MTSEEEARGRLEAFVSHHWTQLGSAAWRHYLKTGKGGALLVSWETVERWEAGRAFTLGVSYVSSASEIPDLEDLITRYVPETSIVVFVTSDAEAARDDSSPTDIEPQPAALRSIKAGS